MEFTWKFAKFRPKVGSRGLEALPRLLRVIECVSSEVKLHTFAVFIWSGNTVRVGERDCGGAVLFS